MLQDEGDPISLSTIYRNLKMMSRMGILRELELAEGHKHYEINQPSPHHHHHLICVRCNKTIEFKNDSILKTGSKTAQKEGYHLLDCQLTIHAICPSCQRSLLACLVECDVQLDLKALWDGHLARPNLGGQDAHPTVKTKFVIRDRHLLNRQQFAASVAERP